MATFPDLRSFDHFVTQSVTAEPLHLQIGDRTYAFDPAKLTVGAMLMMQRVEAESRVIAAKLAAGEKIDPHVIVMDDDEEKRFGIELIGQSNLDQMAADGVLWTEVQHVMATLMAFYMNGEQAARVIWTGEGAKPANPPARAASTKTAGSSTTRTKAKPRSGGRRSSNAGTSSRPTSTASTK